MAVKRLFLILLIVIGLCSIVSLAEETTAATASKKEPDFYKFSDFYRLYIKKIQGLSKCLNHDTLVELDFRISGKFTRSVGEHTNPQYQEPSSFNSRCWVCGGTNGKCDDKESMGSEKQCPPGSLSCFVASSSDAVYRKCGTGQPLGSSSECTKIAINNQDANACWCKGDLCNSGSKITGSFVAAALLIAAQYLY